MNLIGWFLPGINIADVVTKFRRILFRITGESPNAITGEGLLLQRWRRGKAAAF